MNISAPLVSSSIATTTSPFHVNLYKDVLNKNISTDSVKVDTVGFVNKYRDDCEVLGVNQYVTRNINVFFDKLNGKYFDHIEQPDTLIYSLSNKIRLGEIKNCLNVKMDFINGHMFNKEKYKYNDINLVLGKQNLNVRNDVMSIMVILGVIIVLVVIYGKIL